MQLSDQWMDKSNENAKLNSNAASRAIKGKQVADHDPSDTVPPPNPADQPQTARIPAPALGPARRPRTFASGSSVGHPSGAPDANMVDVQFGQDPDKVIYDGDTPVREYDKEATAVSA